MTLKGSGRRLFFAKRVFVIMEGMSRLKIDFRGELELSAGYIGSVSAGIDLKGSKVSFDRKFDR
jgi:hypothetical protein